MGVHAPTPFCHRQHTPHATRHTPHATRHTPHTTRHEGYITALGCAAALSGRSAYSFPSTDLSRLSPSVNAAFRCKAYHARRAVSAQPTYSRVPVPCLCLSSSAQLRRGCLFVPFLVGASSVVGCLLSNRNLVEPNRLLDFQHDDVHARGDRDLHRAPCGAA